MTASELIDVVSAYKDRYVYSDANSEVRYGCDCGCGGDFYTSESWDEMLADAEQAKQEFVAFCEQLGVEWDLD